MPAGSARRSRPGRHSAIKQPRRRPPQQARATHPAGELLQHEHHSPADLVHQRAKAEHVGGAAVGLVQEHLRGGSGRAGAAAGEARPEAAPGALPGRTPPLAP
jgi:hypothetical protein